MGLTYKSITKIKWYLDNAILRYYLYLTSDFAKNLSYFLRILFLNTYIMEIWPNRTQYFTNLWVNNFCIFFFKNLSKFLVPLTFVYFHAQNKYWIYLILTNSFSTSNFLKILYNNASLCKNNACYNAFEKKLTKYVINLSYLKCIKHCFSIVDYRLNPKFDQFRIEIPFKHLIYKMIFHYLTYLKFNF